MDATGNGWVSDAIRCWEYCMSKDTPVLSNSWGGVDYSQALQVCPALAFFAVLRASTRAWYSTI